MSFCLVRIFYFEEKYDFPKIIDVDMVSDLESISEWVQVDDFHEIKKSVYYTLGGQHSSEFLIYYKKQFFMHTKRAPIVFKKKLDMDPMQIWGRIQHISQCTEYGLEEIYALNKRTIERKMNKVLIYAINIDLDLSEENDNVLIIKVDHEKEIYKTLFKHDFVKKFMENYLVIYPRNIKVKNIDDYQVAFHCVLLRDLKELVKTIQDEGDIGKLVVV